MHMIVHGMQVHCCLPCAPRVYSIRIDYCILVFYHFACAVKYIDVR